MTYHSAKSLAEAGKDGFPKCRIDVRVDVERTQIQCGGPVRHMPDGQDAEFTSASSSAKTKRRHLAKSAVGWLSGRETGGGRKRDRKRRKNCSREGKWTRAAKRDSADEQTGSPCRKLLSRWGTQAQNERWPQGGPTGHQTAASCQAVSSGGQSGSGLFTGRLHCSRTDWQL